MQVYRKQMLMYVLIVAQKAMIEGKSFKIPKQTGKSHHLDNLAGC